jgi:two-component system, OmpR family, phosphate regulon response regulator OmpR
MVSFLNSVFCSEGRQLLIYFSIMKAEKHKILVIDDDTRLRNLLTKYLSDNGFEVAAAQNAQKAQEILQERKFDLLVVDVMMPEKSGIDFTKEVRQNSKVPILMLTARGEANDRIDGLEAGADDYMPKPFEPRELLLRINNIFKRSAQSNEIAADQNICQFGDFAFNFDNAKLQKNDEFIHITESEANILQILCQNLGQNVSREDLAQNCGNISTRSIDVQITRLRKKIENNPKQPNFLQTVRNMGYVLSA